VKIAEKLNTILEAKIIMVIKPTKHNIATLKKRGLHSDDSRYFFDMYDTVLSGKSYEKELKDKWDQAIADEFTKAGLKI
jgi:hypothetical protein